MTEESKAALRAFSEYIDKPAIREAQIRERRKDPNGYQMFSTKSRKYYFNCGLAVGDIDYLLMLLDRERSKEER